MCFIENKIGFFRHTVGIAKAVRVIGGDFAFGKPKDVGVLAWGYNQVEFARKDCTFVPLRLPVSTLIRIVGVTLGYNASVESIGKGIYFTNAPEDADGTLNESMNQIEPSDKPVLPPEIFLCDNSGATAIDIGLPVLSSHNQNGGLNYYYDTASNNEIRFFGTGKVIGVPELTGLRSLLVYIGLSYEIISDKNAEKIRKGCPL